MLCSPANISTTTVVGFPAEADNTCTAGEEGRKALEKSKQLVQPLRAAVALPFLGLILFTRFLNPLKGIVLAALPTRYYHDLPEIPIVLYFGFTVLAVIIHR